MAASDDLARIEEALGRACAVLSRFSHHDVARRRKERGDLVTEADLAVDGELRAFLPEAGDGWLSEETADDPSRLERSRVWIVDPLDGTHEFLAGIPEWCVSIGLVEQGRPVAGGIANPATNETVVGATGIGVTWNGVPCRMRGNASLDGADVLASRSESGRGEWRRFDDAPFRVRPVGSVAYKLGLVAAGRADATWTLQPKHEWDVAAGVALVLAAGGVVWVPGEGSLSFNRRRPRLSGLAAASAASAPAVHRLLDEERTRVR
jgi:myo-inositol-1(or 4)-monophosphatase